MPYINTNHSLSNSSFRIAFFTAAFFANNRWPPWLPLYLRTCEANRELGTWFIISDMLPPLMQASNVHFIQTSLRDIEQRFMLRTGLNISLGLHSFYKLGSDYHSAYADLFSAYLEALPPGTAANTLTQPFTHWAHTDLDVFYGNLSRFVTPALLRDYDVISGQQGQLCGPLTIFRNRPELRKLYQHAPGFKEAFENSTNNETFDEDNMSRAVVSSGYRVKWDSPGALNLDDVYQFHPGNCARSTNCKAAFCHGEVFNFMMPPNVRMFIHMAAEWQAVARNTIRKNPSLLNASCWYISSTEGLQAFHPDNIRLA